MSDELLKSTFNRPCICHIWQHGIFLSFCRGWCCICVEVDLRGQRHWPPTRSADKPPYAPIAPSDRLHGNASHRICAVIHHRLIQHYGTLWTIKVWVSENISLSLPHPLLRSLSLSSPLSLFPCSPALSIIICTWAGRRHTWSRHSWRSLFFMLWWEIYS